MTELFKPANFKHSDHFRGNLLSRLDTAAGRITVLDRMTGYGNGDRDIESGYRDLDGKFWLAICGVDVRESGATTVAEAIEYIKSRAGV